MPARERIARGKAHHPLVTIVATLIGSGFVVGIGSSSFPSTLLVPRLPRFRGQTLDEVRAEAHTTAALPR
jgi:hypothetical protein